VETRERIMSFKIVEGRLVLMVQSIIRDCGPRLQNDINALMSKMYIIIIIIIRRIYTERYSLSIVINISITYYHIIIININIIIIAYDGFLPGPIWLSLLI